MALSINGVPIISNGADISNVGVATFGLLDAKINEKIVTESPTITGTTVLDQLLIYDAETDTPKKITMEEFVPGANNIGTLNLEGPVGGFRNSIVNGSFRVDSMDEFKRESNVGGQEIDLKVFDTANARTIVPGWRTHLIGNGADNISVTYARRTAYLDGEVPPDNISTYLQYAFTSAGLTPSSGIFIDTTIENYNTFMGQDVTYSFYARSAGGADLPIQPIFAFVRAGDPQSNWNPDLDEYVLPPVVINQTWNRYSINFTFPVSAPAIDPTESHLVLRFIIASGSTYANSFTGGVPLNNPSGILLLTGTQLERGSEPTKFEEYDLSTEYMRCQRYGTYEFNFYNPYAYVSAVNSPNGPASNKTVTITVPYRTTTSMPAYPGNINLMRHPAVNGGNFVIIDSSGSFLYNGDFSSLSLTAYSTQPGIISYNLVIVQSSLSRVPSTGESLTIFNLHHYFELNRISSRYLFPAP